MTNLLRFDFNDRDGIFEVVENGDWVRATDYDALAAKLAAAERVARYETDIAQQALDQMKAEKARAEAAEVKLAAADAMIEAQQKDYASNNVRFAEAEHRAKAAEAALPAVYRLALADAEFACTNVIKNYDVTYDGGKKFAPMKTQNAAKGMVSIAREDIRALPTPTAAELMARIQTGEK